MEDQHSSKKNIVILVVVVVVFIILGVSIYLLSRSKVNTPGTKSFGALFGGSATLVTPTNGSKITGSGSTGGGSDTLGGDAVEPLFRQLTTMEVAGAVAVEKAGKTYVRYISRENGYVYDVDPKTGNTTQLTNTVIPRIYEAYFALGGNTVILRYLKHDDLARKDIIKTQIADLVLPVDTTGSTTVSLGSLSSFDPQLPDNIASISISPDGTKLFYILPVNDGVSGTVVNIATRVGVEVFRNSFSEWLPQLLDSGNIILTTKASANVEGYSYLYDTGTKTLSRLVREKIGLTTLSNRRGERMIYSENLLGVTTLGLYDKKGFELDEGGITHTAALQLATLPEKCAWSVSGVRIYCGAFASTPKAQIPDEWYQGALSFTDTFWTINTDLSDLVFLADPKREVGKTLDVVDPFLDKSEDHFFFIDKNDSTLWSLRLEKSKYTSSNELHVDTAAATPPLTPEEMKDALGSTPTTTKKIVTPKKSK